MWDKDYITGELIEFEELSDAIQEVCYEAIEKELWGWCNPDQFEEVGSLWLRTEKIEGFYLVGKIEIEEAGKSETYEKTTFILGEYHLKLAGKISNLIGI